MTHAIKLLRKTIKAFKQERIKHQERVKENRLKKGRIVKAIRSSNLPQETQRKELMKLKESRLRKFLIGRKERKERKDYEKKRTQFYLTRSEKKYKEKYRDESP